MTPNPKSAFDVGPLSWVKAEIEHSLAEMRSHLDALANDPGDAKAAQYAATHLHQVTGALTMVGLGAASRFSEEIEKLVESLASDPDARAQAPQRITSALAATAALSAYLDNLMAGEPDRPMLLARAYLEVNKARGGDVASETDLFSPDLSLAIIMPDNTVALPKPEMLAEAIKQRRSMYQAGLLKLLRDKDLVGGAREMRNATLAIEALQVTSPTVSFWYTASGFFDAVATNPAEAGAMAVQLFGKIDQQIKLLVDGVQKIPEKLFRDLLLVIGRSKANTERLKRIRELYRLDELLAVPVVYGALGADDKTKSVVRTLRDHVQEQKENWLRFASGNRASLEQFVAQSAPFYTIARQQLNLDLAEVVQTIGMVGSHLHKSQAPADDSLALEMATALLFLESSLENYFRLSSDFRAQANNIIQRLKAALTGTAPPPSKAGTSALMGDISKRAQERMLMFQVGQEVQVNLASIEGALDAFFRDSTKRADVNALGPLFSQVQGALTILELDDAAALNQLLRERVELFASGEIAGVGEDADAVAEGVSALGLYVSALQQGTSQPRTALLPALIRFGLVNKPVEPDRTLTKSPVSKADIDVAKQKVQERYADWKQQPEQTSSRDQLREAVKELKLDATLIADSDSARQSDEMLKAIDQTFDPHKTGLMTAVAEIAPDKPTKAPSSQTVQLIDASNTEVDSELLEIFLEEAGEVVATIREHLGKLRGNPHDEDALITIRRGYHTLKGSGRMVGLVDLGEVAWNCEQVLNKWLKDETPATAGLLGFVEHTASAFATWVDALGNASNAPVDGSAIARMAEILKNGEEPEFATTPPAGHDAIAGAQPTEVRAPTELVDTVAADVLSAPSLTGTPAPASVPADALLPVNDSVPLADVSSGAISAAEQPALVTVPVPALPSFAPETEIAPEPEDVRVGTNMVPHALFNIYLGEAEQHVTTLDNELSALEAKPMLPVSHDFMRAAHTLASSSRTTNFEMIADVAAALEKWAHDAIEFSPALDSWRLGVMRQAVDALSGMVMGLHTHELPAQREDLVRELMELREALKLAKRAESTHAGVPPPVPLPRDSSADVFDFLPSDAPPTVDVEPVAIAPPPPPVPAVETFAPQPTPEPIVLVESPPATPVFAPAALAGAAALGIAATGLAASRSDAAGSAIPAIAEPAFESGKEKRRIEDDVDSDLLPIFLEEAREIVPKVGDCTRVWRARPADHTPVIELARHLHTLKGSARMAGLMRLGELAHVIESQMIAMDADAAPDTTKFDQIDEYFDRFTGTLDLLHAGEKPATLIDVPVAHVFEHQKDKPATIAVMAAAAQAVRDEAAPDGRERQSLLRVNADIIDRFVNDAGELSIARSRIDQEMLTFKQSLLELTENISRMKAQVREIEIQSESQIQSRVKEAEERGTAFDPLEFDRFSRTQELTRFIAESLNDVVTLQLSLQKNIDETEAALIQQARLNRDLQQGLMGVRLVPLGNLQDRFYRLMRQTAKELGKKANLEFRGVRVEIDRSVLEKITSPFEHLLRNAVAHGLEQPRGARQKRQIGNR